MKTEQISVQPGKQTFAVVLAKGDEVIARLLDFARQRQLSAAYFTGIGGWSDATLAYFDRAGMEYKHLPVPGQVEVLSLLGNITLADGQPKVHAHAVVGLPDGSTRGGHVLEAHVWPTLELFLVESGEPLHRARDPETGLDLIHI